MDLLSQQIGFYSVCNSLKFLFLITYALEHCQSMKHDEIESHLEMGRLMLAKGQYNDALSHYHAAVDADPKNYLTYFKRATVYLALGKYKAALDDLSEVIQLKPDFLAARLQRGSILYKQGRLDEAHIDYEWVLRADPYNEEAIHAYSMVEPLKHEIQNAYLLINDGRWFEAVDLLTKLLHDLPWDVKLREMRSTAYEKLGDLMNAISDLRATTKMRSDNTEGYLKLSKLHYDLGESEESLNTIRECLKLDPDHKPCFNFYKKVKKLAGHIKAMNDFAQENDFGECAQKGNAALKVESDSPQMVYVIKSKMCQCLSKGGNADKAIEACTETLRIFPDDVNVLCDRAEAHLNNENLNEALNDYQRAAQIDEHSTRAKEGIQKVQKMLKQSKKRNYYKILGVARNANKKEIIKAYRKLASKWHPDQFQGDEKKTAEANFIDIAAAKEVLTDPEKRQKFDNGEDPLDPEEQAHHQHGFPHGFNPFDQFGGFGSNGYTFKFKFS